ncbi:MAG: hypothetical protein Q8P79_00390 [Nanoarchaeota archaeon]|nr:hypothetical protein [Nanoarchaeota archaeon]
MVSYILLVVFAVVIGGIIFAWLRTYVPSQGLSCPDGTSVFIKESSFNDSTLKLNLILRNSGRFDIAGYFIQATNNSEQEVATLDLSSYLNESFGGKKFGSSVVFVLGQNAMGPGDTNTNIFDIPSGLGEPYSVNIIPTRYQIEDNRQRFVSCSEARVQNLVGAPGEECVPETISETCGTWICGNKVNNCGQSVSCPPNNCGSGFFCDASGQCISTSCTPATDPTFSGVCGTRVCDTATNGTCGEVDCGTCLPGNECNPSGQCVSTIGNGICDPGETCAQEPVACNGQQAQCLIGQICQGGICQSDGSYGPDDYCRDLNQGYSTGFCATNLGQCQSQGGTLKPAGDYTCTGGLLACCQP